MTPEDKELILQLEAQQAERFKQVEALAKRDNERHAREPPSRPFTPEELKAREAEIEHLINETLARKGAGVSFDPVRGYVTPFGTQQRKKLRGLKLNIRKTRFSEKEP
jgi:hypothetical protein